ncbi:MAG: flagellar motor protein MotB [Candidatus Gastranaerophilales bacterium]|nr:flagellar motor protein MotB [Candidatus Gastranaerophilales bacterium]
MAKKKEETPPPGSPAWMATFSDLMNLLLCFFVLLFSMSTIDEAKLAEIVAAMNSSFSVFNGGATAIGDGMLISNGVSQLNELSEYINSTGAAADSTKEPEQLEQFENDPEVLQQIVEEILEEQNLQENEQLAEQVEEAVSESNLSDQIEVTFTSQYVQLTMKGALLFDSGSAELKENSASVLDRVGIILMRYSKGIVEIEGHTDNVPMSSARYADNEELSSARALTVFYYLKDHTALDPVNLRHAGMGERIPIADNSTEEGRSKNRRVEIRIYNNSQ